MVTLCFSFVTGTFAAGRASQPLCEASLLRPRHENDRLNMARLLHLDVECASEFAIVRGRSREYIKACFCQKIYQFLLLSVLGNRSIPLLLPIDLPAASILRFDRTSLKSNRINSKLLLSGILFFIHQPVCCMTARLIPLCRQSQKCVQRTPQHLHCPILVLCQV